MDRERVRQLQAALVAARDMRHVELRKEAPRDVVLDTIKDDINGLQAELQLYLPHPGGADSVDDANALAMLRVVIEMLNNLHTKVSEAFDNMFAPTIRELSQRSHQATKFCIEAYNPADRPSTNQLWCMVLGQYLDRNLIKSCHIYKRQWPAVYAAKLHLDVDSAANLFSSQKKIQSAFDRFRLIIMPESLTDFRVHILDPTLGPEMLNHDIKSADGSVIRFAELDGTSLNFATEARPAKRAFALHAQAGLRFARKVGWAAAINLSVPPTAWGSDTCDAGIREQFLSDAISLSNRDAQAG